MIKEKALHKFWSSFAYPAYEENSVPSGTAFPYITYQVVTDNFDNGVSLTASIWDKEKDGYSANLSNAEKAQEISDYIGLGGIITNGMWVTRGNPFAQSMGDNTESMIRRKVLNITVEFLESN